ncbi:unnamed protein product [Protopolystoma xenopodis]|uniref:Uncharacterized protein n=1 Tax=Protopolystoma xenopodis TaxID=117903 RepID=A0A3S5BJZ0_9PLAT|nr:unnamed protein product [Protopolystoma xenopodis]
MARLRSVGEAARRWTRLVELPVTSGLRVSDSQPEAPNIATLTGIRSRFLIRSKQVRSKLASCNVLV